MEVTPMADGRPESAGPISPPAAGSDAVVEFARTRREVAGAALLVPAALLLALTLYLGYKGFSPGPKADALAGEKAPAADLAPKAAANLNAPDYLWGFVFAVAAALPLLSVGVWFAAGLPFVEPAADRTRVRVALLAAGGLTGLALMLAGLLFFVRWIDGLIKWLDGGGTADLRGTVYALTMLALGAGLLLLAIQPARAEERNNALLRRLVYGSNLALVLLLLVAVLLAGNAVASQKVPNKLDTTATGFYSLSPETESYLGKLDQPVAAYGLLPEGYEGETGRVVDDIRRMLLKCQEVSGGKFTLRFISLTTGAGEYERLKAKYPGTDLNRLGVLLTVDDGKRHSFLRADEFRTSEGQGAGAKEAFVGEGRLLKELSFLTENAAKPVVYFTQSSGEMQIGEAAPGGRQVPPQLSARKLKDYLDKNNVDVRPLTFDLGTTRVPDDAAAVVVAQPAAPLGGEAEAAIRKYMADPRPDGKKGKLVVLAGTPIPPGDAPVRTGLESLLEEYDVRLDDRYLYSERMNEASPETTIVTVDPAAAEAGNPVARTFASTGLSVRGCREVVPLQTNPKYQALPLLMTYPDRGTWLERLPPSDPDQAWLNLRKSAALIREKEAAKGGRPRDRFVAVLSSEGTTGRLAVFGCSTLASDAASRGGGANRAFELLGATVDWLRDRPTAGPAAASKVYTDYRIDPKMDVIRLLWMPLGLGVLAIAGIGTGVWIIRRS